VTLVTLARIASVVGAGVWLLGWPLIVLSAEPFTNDTTYYLAGILLSLEGVLLVPIVVAYPVRPPAQLVAVVKGLGVIVCAALTIFGALLVAGSLGSLGATAPSWIVQAADLSVIGSFCWIGVVSFTSDRLARLGSLPRWLGSLAAASFLIVAFIAANWPGAVNLLLILPVWLCLPGWFVALAVRLRSQASNPSQPTAQQPRR
jgi:hypothetical protein